MEKPIVFKNKIKKKLLGILHTPDEISVKKTGILFVHSGVQGRHGNTNQYVYYARSLCKQGYACLRFDPYGLGDSEGVIESMDMRDFYGSIQTGRYVEDTLCATEEFLKTGVDNVVLFGLCGGAITALLTAADSDKISGLILLSIPTLLDSAEVDYNKRIPKEIAKKHLNSYLSKIFYLKSWGRLLLFKSNFSSILKYAAVTFSNTISKSENRFEESDNQANRLFLNAYSLCTQANKKILWFFGGNDSFYFDFKKNILERDLLEEKDTLFLIENANHMFTLPEWQEEILSKTTKWLKFSV